jgi:predicted nucleic acid-binding protein
MCTIIDVNAIPAIFNNKDLRHEEFRPVIEWINNRNGKVVYGGSKYKSELKKLGKYLPYIAELSRKGKVVIYDDFKIDTKEQLIEVDLRSRGIRENDKRFNDAHLVAIVSVAKVKIITSNDISSIGFLRDTRYYDHKSHRPVFYTRRRNENLLKDPRYFSSCCN